jgi:heme exporter protein C
VRRVCGQRRDFAADASRHSDAIGAAIHRFANPGRFLHLASQQKPWLAGATAISLAVGLYFALIASRPDYQQGETVRIMHIHVSVAWIAMFACAWVGLVSPAALIWRHPLADVAADAASPVGAVFTLLALVSGSLWGQPMWGTYWAGDVRPNPFLLLFFLYIGQLVLLKALDEPASTTRSEFAGHLLSQKTGRRPSARTLLHPTEALEKG